LNAGFFEKRFHNATTTRFLTPKSMTGIAPVHIAMAIEMKLREGYVFAIVDFCRA